MNQHKRILGALALALSLCFVFSALAINDNSNDNYQTENVLASSASPTSLSFTGGSASISISSASATVRLSGSDSSISIDWSISWGDGTSNSATTNGTGSTSKSHTYSSNGTYTISISGNRFIIDTDTEDGSAGSGTSRVTVDSYSVAKNYTVTYNANGGTGTVSSRTVTEGTSISLSSGGFSRTGYDFTGWRLGSASGTFYNPGASYTVNSNVTFYAAWEPKEYSVSFNANGGTGSIASKTVEYGNSTTLPSSGFTREGYTLSGWNTSSNGSGTDYALGATVSNIRMNYKFYAVWEAVSSVNPSSLQFPSYGSISLSVSDDTVTVSATGAETSESYDWHIDWGDGTLGSSISVNGTASQSAAHKYMANGTYTISIYAKSYELNTDNPTGTSDTKTSEIKIGSYSASTTYTISFNGNGATNGSIDSWKVASGTTITLPNAGFSKTGSEFKGWKLNSASGTHYDSGASYTVNSNVTFYAEWAVNSYSVSFNANGGTGSIASKTVEYGNSTTLPSSGFTREGYDLAGWNTSTDGSGTDYALGSSYTVNTSITFYAVWEADTFSVSFNSNGGTGEIASQTVQPGVSIKLPQSGFTKAGYILMGWTLNSTTGTFYDIGASYTVNSNVTFYASWVQEPSGDHGAPTEIKVGETYDFSPNMQSSAWGLYIEVSGNSSYTINYTGPDWLKQTGDKRQLKFEGTPTEPGTYHVTIKLNGENTKYTDASKIEWYIIVTEDVPDSFTASFNSNGGTGSVASLNTQPNNAVTLPSEGFIKTGYTLIGWSEGSAAGPTYNLGSIYTVTSDVTFYAKWIANSNLVVFDANGGVGNTTYIAATNDNVTLPSEGFTKTGCILAGWYLSENPEAVYAPGYTYMISGQTTMYAYWIANGTSYITVTYNANGGTGDISSQITESGKSVVLPSSGFNKSGNNMTGWNINADGSGIGYDLGAYVVVTSNKTFYAQWSSAEAADVTVTFNLNGGYGSVASQTVKAGSVINQPSTPVRDGHIFKGWRVIGGADWDFTKPVSESMTLMAQWDQHFTITNNYLIVNVTVNAKYAGGIHTVNWGDGTKETKTGSTFSHTYSSASAGRITITTAVDDSAPVSSSLPYNLTNEPVFTVTFVNGEQVVKTTVINGKTVAVPEEILVDPECRIEGWYTDADCKTKYDFDAPVTKNITLYANVVSGDTPSDNSNLVWFVIATLAALVICVLVLIFFKIEGIPIAVVVAIVYICILYVLGMI